MSRSEDRRMVMAIAAGVAGSDLFGSEPAMEVAQRAVDIFEEVDKLLDHALGSKEHPELAGPDLQRTAGNMLSCVGCGGMFHRNRLDFTGEFGPQCLRCTAEAEAKIATLIEPDSSPADPITTEANDGDQAG